MHEVDEDSQKNLEIIEVPKMGKKQIVSNQRKAPNMHTPSTVKHANRMRIPPAKASGLHTTEPSPERGYSDNDNYLSTQSDLNEQKF